MGVVHGLGKQAPMHACYAAPICVLIQASLVCAGVKLPRFGYSMCRAPAPTDARSTSNAVHLQAGSPNVLAQPVLCVWHCCCKANAAQSGVVLHACCCKKNSPALGLYRLIIGLPPESLGGSGVTQLGRC